MRSTRDHRGVSAETSTLPRTSDGQNGAVAVVGSLNKGYRGVVLGNTAILAGERCGLLRAHLPGGNGGCWQLRVRLPGVNELHLAVGASSRRVHAQQPDDKEFLLEVGRRLPRSALRFAGLLFREGVNRFGHRFEPLARNRLAALVGQPVSAVLDLLQGAIHALETSDVTND